MTEQSGNILKLTRERQRKTKENKKVLDKAKEI